MCEHIVARADEPFRLDELWPLVEAMERYGLAGFGWGAAWATGDAAAPFATHREARAFREDDAGRASVGAVETTSLLVHLRRPSRLSTLGHHDTQPFVDPAHRFVFAHNGDLRDWRPWRRQYQAQGRIVGRADSEVGFRWLEDAWQEHEPVGHLLGALHDTFGGEANLALLTPDGRAWTYAGNPENPVFSYRLGRIRVISTGIYSIDRSLFRYAAHGATERSVVPLRRTLGS